MAFVIGLLSLALVGWLLYGFVADFSTATGTLWDRLLAAGKDSATKLVARLTMLVSAASGALVYLADALNQPQLSEAIKAALKPEYVAVFGVVVAVLTVVARNRTMDR